VVYLRASADAVWTRVASRARPEEAAMRREYLDAVCATYEDFFSRPPIGMRVVTVDWEAFGTAEAAWSRIEVAYTRGFDVP
jgi:deoxyadenosine/deoxycytidine kinase